MIASGIVASMSSTAETSCPHANPADPLLPSRMDGATEVIFAYAARTIRSALDAMMAGLLSVKVGMGSSSVVSVIQPVSGRGGLRRPHGKKILRLSPFQNVAALFRGEALLLPNCSIRRLGEIQPANELNERFGGGVVLPACSLHIVFKKGGCRLFD